MSVIHQTKLPVEETIYAALGGGLGSFAWVDSLRISGVRTDNIKVLGVEEKPYGRYQRLCKNSQIPDWERLRSGSDSTPDNIWAWPGYAWREAWREISSGQISSALYHLWQVFAEPILADTYTPRAGDVFASLDREANRIGWQSMLRKGRILKIRKTEDGRYAIAYSCSQSGRREKRFLIANYAQLAIGYPAVNFLPDLQEYRLKTGDFKSIVNAYEYHEHVYEHLAEFGGTIILRGRGIVASRIVQRISEVKQQNPGVKISIVHLMRSSKSRGNKSGKAQRIVENQWEFQPYNWPKAAWGGDAKVMIERASATERQRLLSEWGGTTTAERRDWRDLVRDGLDGGWYQIIFGNVERVDRNDQGRLISFVATRGVKGQMKVEGDFIIDATGLEAKPEDSLLLNDLIQHYNLSLNPIGRLDVNQDFEIVGLRNNQARMYGAGSMTLGGPYAPVDSFIGLQYSARQAADDLANLGAPEVKYLNGWGSFLQWLKWVQNQNP